MIRYIDINGIIHESVIKTDLSYESERIAEILDVTEIKGEDKLKNVQLFILKRNKIKEIKGLVRLTGLRLLALSSNQIEEIKGLEKMYSLYSLYLNFNRIKEIKGLDRLTSLEELNLFHNNIREIKGLDKLTNLRELNLSFNDIKEIKGLDSLINLDTLNLHNNQIKEINGLDCLINLQVLNLSDNQITEMKGLDGLINLRRLDLSHNQITEIKGLDRLTNLDTLYLCHNQITEINEISTNLHYLFLSHNQITEINEVHRLTNLHYLFLSHNQITHVPFTIMNLRHLTHLVIDCEVNIIIERFLNRNTVKDNKTIYGDSQNVHDSDIVKSVKQSIYNIMDGMKSIPVENISKEIIDDEILTNRTKSQLIEYCEDKTVHSLLNLTFEEILCSVWKVITEHKESQEIKKILNEEMKDSMCKCFTGRLSRLINCLNGFDDRVSIKISGKSQILNVIINVRNKYIGDVSKQKEEVIKELTERGFDEEIINEYIVYLE